MRSFLHLTLYICLLSYFLVIHTACNSNDSEESKDSSPSILQQLASNNPDERLQALQKAQKMGEKAEFALKNISDILQDKEENLQVRKAAVRALFKIGSAAFPYLKEAAKSQDGTTQSLAVKGVGMFASSKSFPPEVLQILAEALKSKNSDVCSEAAEALSEYKVLPKSLVVSFQETAKDEHWQIRKVTATALGRIQEEESLFILLALLKDSDWRVRMAVVESIGRIKTISLPSISELILTLEDSDKRVQMYTLDALKMVMKAIEKSSHQFQTSKEAFSVLFRALGHEQGHRRKVSYDVLCLSQIPEDISLDNLINSLVSSFSQARSLSKKFLAKIYISNPNVLSLLEEELSRRTDPQEKKYIQETIDYIKK